MVGVEDVLVSCLDRGISFVAFRWYGQVHLWAQHRPDLHRVPLDALDKLQDLFLLAPFMSDYASMPAIRPDVRLLLSEGPNSLEALDACLQGPLHAGARPMPWSAEGHAKAIAAAKDQFARGTLRKVVLARTLAVDCSPALLPALFVAAMESHRNAFVCLLHTPEHGTWLGASPERLLHVEGDAITVDAIAGTLPVELAPVDVSAWGAKERDEQELVTDAVLRVFTSQGLDAVRCSGPRLLHAGPIAHLQSQVQALLGTSSLAALVKALHPTPAVCGTPLETARSFLLEHEPHDRGPYAGYWGPWQVNGRTDLFVNIRCLQAFADRAYIHVGGGITAGSIAGHEWQETVQKARTWTDPIDALNSRIS